MKIVKPVAAAAFTVVMSAAVADADTSHDPAMGSEVIVEEAAASSGSDIVVPLLVLIILGVALAGTGSFS